MFGLLVNSSNTSKEMHPTACFFLNLGIPCFSQGSKDVLALAIGETLQCGVRQAVCVCPKHFGRIML